jgi:capsular polysaccharide biosynthesis protein
MESKDLRRENYYCDDEIDLYELWLLLRKRKWIVLFTTLFFLILSLAYLYITKPVYRLEHYLALPIFKNAAVTESLSTQLEKGITVLNTYLENQDYSQVASLLNLSENDVRNLVSIDILAKARKKEKAIFAFSIDSYDRESLTKFDYAFLNYLKSLPSVSQTLFLYRKELKDKLSFYKGRLGEVLNVAEEAKKKVLSTNSEVIGFNPVSLETTIVNYQSQIASLERELKELVPFKDINRVIYNKPVKPKKKLVIAVALISGLFIGVFLVFFLEWLDSMKKRRREETG